MSVHVFGIRHHGPGCARCLRDALTALAPDIVLLEGPPDAHAVLSLAGSPDMQPPIALLVYPVDAPSRAVFYPFAEFSPEWQALRYALARSVPVRFIDLPQALRLAAPDREASVERAERDPLDLFAEAAGYADHELWWEHQIERHEDPTGLFDAIFESMQAVRGDGATRNALEAQREAHMRTMIRAAVKEGRERIAVVCGAWHAPVLVNYGTAKEDALILKGLQKTKVEATWIPWTHSRLSFRSGYGAGVQSPGWYQHLWTAPDRAVIRWVVEAARLLRSEDLDASPASVIEVVRLAETVAALRGLRSPGLAELNEATVSILCGGDSTRMQLVRERLEVGFVLGSVPSDTPTVPLQRDLQALQKSLRIKASSEIRKVELDLRNDTDRERSRLFHRMMLLDIPWAAPRASEGRKLGTFHETWELRWMPEMEVAIIEASIWGHTIEAAADARARSHADDATDLAALTPILDRTLLAELPRAVDYLLARVEERAAVGADVQHMMQALPPLARASRYGDVRKTPTEALLLVIAALFERVVVGLPLVCSAIDDDAAAQRLEAMMQVQSSLGLLDDAEAQGEWETVLRRLVDDDTVHGLIRGWSCRSLFERGRIDGVELDRYAGLALSPVMPALEAAAWMEGLLRGSGMLLMHQEGVWAALDTFLSRLRDDAFQEMLPLMRRAFASFTPPERRAMGEKVMSLRASPADQPRRASAVAAAPIDIARANAVLPVLARILGVETT